MNGVELIAAERRRQSRSEKYGRKHDDGHCFEEIARAAAVYALPESYRSGEIVDGIFPWPGSYKPTPDDRIRELAKAGALIAAEIDRLRRKARSGA